MNNYQEILHAYSVHENKVTLVVGRSTVGAYWAGGHVVTVNKDTWEVNILHYTHRFWVFGDRLFMSGGEGQDFGARFEYYTSVLEYTLTGDLVATYQIPPSFDPKCKLHENGTLMIEGDVDYLRYYVIEHTVDGQMFHRGMSLFSLIYTQYWLDIRIQKMIGYYNSFQHKFISRPE